MKKIGLVDYYISEWHANNYPKWFKEICEKDNLEYEVAYAWAEEYVSPVNGENTDQWCKRNNVERCLTIEELCEKSDYIIILSPSNPEKHLGYAEKVLPFGKPTYIDKTFSPDYKTALEIYALGEKYNTPFFSSSALRYATELDDIIGRKSVVAMGGGALFDEYLVHLVEMVVKVMDAKATRLCVDKQGEKQYNVRVDFEGDKTATMIFYPPMPHAISSAREDGKESVFRLCQSETFKGLLSDILRFFSTGEVSFSADQTKEIMKIREFAIKGAEELGQWINL